MDAPEATVNAVEYELRTNGEASFATPGCQRRLAALSPAQVFEVIARLARQRPKYPAITNEVLSRLGEHAG